MTGSSEAREKAEHAHSLPSTVYSDRVEKTTYFQGESLEFVADWLEKNNLSKLKSVFKGTFILNC